jgi:hypothetical protein
MIELYARIFGIGDMDVMEAPWVADWISRNHNRLVYNDLRFRWFLQ